MKEIADGISPGCSNIGTRFSFDGSSEASSDVDGSAAADGFSLQHVPTLPDLRIDFRHGDKREGKWLAFIDMLS